VIAVFQLQNETVHIHTIPVQPLTDLLNGTKHSFCVDTAESSVGQLTIDMSPDAMIGTGAFKSAHPGWLTLTAPPIKGLRSQARHKVVVKQPFYRVYSDAATQSGPYKIGQYSLADDIKKLFVEANVLFWEKSLLQLTYTFIDHCIASSLTPLPFSIPCVCFVEAGLALSFAQGVSKVTTKAGSAWAVFLLEELIRGSDEAFMKFIHNMDSNPSYLESIRTLHGLSSHFIIIY
ncbi:hypothetical protein PAXRUDRAFT_782224, partial [Paxillus rubicundulus Ve08.2h10]